MKCKKLDPLLPIQGSRVQKKIGRPNTEGSEVQKNKTFPLSLLYNTDIYQKGHHLSTLSVMGRRTEY